MDQTFNEFIGNFIHHHSPARRSASLSARSKSALSGRLYGQVQVGVLQNNNRILSTHLALNLGAASRRLFIKTNAYSIRSGERDRFYCWMINNLVTCV